MNKQYLLYCELAQLFDTAEQLAKFTKQIKVVNTAPLSTEVYLCLGIKGLAIMHPQFKPLYVSDIYKQLPARTNHLSNELLIKAVKLPNTIMQDIKHKEDIHIWDLTAGFALDAGLLANYGYHITMVEYHPILATILYYALINNYLPQACVNLLYADSEHVLGDYAAYGLLQPHVIYLDPLFYKASNAKANKSMQIIQSLASDMLNNAVTMCIRALNVAQVKVVVKRALKQPPLIPHPAYKVGGTSIRFDVYTDKARATMPTTITCIKTNFNQYG